MEFRKQEMEADALKDQDHMSQWTANDPARLVSSPSKITEKAMSFLLPGQINSTNDSFNEQFTPLCYSADSSMMDSNGSSLDNRFHGQAFQDALFPHLLSSSVTQTGILQTSKSNDLETLSPPLPPAALQVNQETICFRNMEKVQTDSWTRVALPSARSPAPKQFAALFLNTI